MNGIRRFFASMVGRLFLILLIGMSVAAVLATLLAEARRHQELDYQSLVSTADRLQAFVEMLDSHPELRERLLDLGGPGVLHVALDTAGLGPDPVFAAVLAAQPYRLEDAQVETTAVQNCLPMLLHSVPPPTVARRNRPFVLPVCRLVRLHLSDGTPLTLALETPAIVRSAALATDSIFLSLLGLAIALLAYIVARIACQPLRHLADAADELGRNLQHEPLALRGPLEVRSTAQAFNAMQRRLQRHLAERTQMLAAITHDLQTPLTRLRLRLENVPDETLRERLIGDLTAMNALVREGLELARSAETSEQPVALDLDSLLESVVEDAADTGGDAVFEQGCGAVLMLRPLAMHRLFSNLIDNALKYGHAARVSVQAQDGGVTVWVRDRGTGLSEEELERVFDPFVRLETSRSRQTGGAGLGLTIARTLAERDGATLVLHNRDRGGLEAIVHWIAPTRQQAFRP